MANKLSLIPGVLLAAVAAGGVAHAAVRPIGVRPAALSGAQIPAANRFYMSGSTALDNVIKDLLTLAPGANNGACANGTMDVYYDGTSYTASSTHGYAVTCTLAKVMTDGTHTVAIGQNVAFFKDGAGGSFEGTKPEADQTTRTYLNIDVAGGLPAACAAGVAFDTNNTPSGTPYFPREMTSANATEHASCTATTTVIPVAGFSDVNADMFTANNGYPGLTPLNLGEIGKLSAQPLFQQQFGFAVSLNLYRVLQSTQGKTVGSDAAIDIPSVSKAALSAIAAGNFTDWSQILNPAGTVAITDASFIGPNQTAPVAIAPNVVTQLYLCRRGDQSGTEASANSYLLNNQCGAGNVPGSSTPQSLAVGNTPVANCSGVTGGVSDENGCKWQAVNLPDTIFPGNGTGDVDACLNAHDLNNAYAIGWLSGDRKYDDPMSAANAKFGFGGSGDTSNAAPPAGTSTAHRWRYIAIDGKKPNLESVASGIYDFAEDNVLYWNTAVVNANANSAAFIGFLKSDLATIAIIGELETVQTHGTTGPILDPLNAGAAVPNTLPLSVAINTNPVSSWSKAGGGGVQDCGAPVLETAPVLDKPSSTPVQAVPANL